MPRPLRATIDLDALRHNHARARLLAPQSRTLAVVKADAYGHGLVECALALESDGYAMLSLEEARLLRDLGVTRPLLLLEGFFSEVDLKELRETRATPVIHHGEQIRMLELSDLPPPARVFLKLDTGMHRLGFAPAEGAEAVRRLYALQGVSEVVLMSHYACADVPGGTDQACRRIDELRAWHPAFGTLPTSFANSAAIMAQQAFADAPRLPLLGDWVRPGLMLYGASPLEGITAAALGLRPVMRLHSALIAVRSIAAGEAVGYGATFVADRPMRVGVVACGYADGYPRHAPSGTPVLVDGRRTRLLGRVSMDMLAVDLTAVPQAAPGTPVELFGPDLPVDEVAFAANTISYQILTGIARRVPVSIA